jgi:lactate dehydrogenase-like 2-hydroxyacid dehydrogenase
MNADDKLATAGLDVFPNEPEINPKLRAMKHITILPHMGTETRDTQKKVSQVLVMQKDGIGLTNRWNYSYSII